MERLHVPAHLILVFLGNDFSIHLFSLGLGRLDNFLNLQQRLARGGIAVKRQGSDDAAGGIELFGMDLLFLKAGPFGSAAIALAGALTFAGAGGIAPSAFAAA